MDTASFSLLARVVETQLGRLRRLLAFLTPDQRGSTYIKFVSHHLDAIASLIQNVEAEYGATTSDAERIIIGRKLYRLKLFLDDIHGNVVEYKDDIGRRDLPVGLLHVIDALIEDLLKASADPIVHLGQQYMYSTIRVADQWSNMSAELGLTWSETIEPIIFNLPGLDPSNAFLSPILAHEVGHAVIQRHDLVADVDARLDVATIDALKSAYAATPSADVGDALAQFGRWVDELLCDALATELTGPGLLFAGAVFLPASSAGHSGPDHPDPAQRIALSLNQLDRSGWLDHLNGRCPTVMQWLRQVASLSPDAPTPLEVFLRGLVDIASDAILEVAQEYVVDGKLAWSEYCLKEQSIHELLTAGIPPAELDGDPISPWYVVASMWLHAIDHHGDSAEGLADAVADTSMSQFALKTVEMSRVLELWKAEDASSA